jgi:hypothetical protein
MQRAMGDAVEIFKISTEMEHLPSMDTKKSFTPIKFKDGDLRRLEAGEWLNHVLIDYWIAWISSHPSMKNVVCFDSSLYTRLIEDGLPIDKGNAMTEKKVKKSNEKVLSFDDAFMIPSINTYKATINVDVPSTVNTTTTTICML